MEQLSSGIGSDVGDCVVPSSSSEDQSLVRSSSADATISFQEGHKCLQCHTLQQKIDSLKKQDGVYQTLKQKIVKTDTLIKKYVSKRQECEELQKKNEDLAHKYSLLMKNYKALENQLGNTVKELLPWKLDKDRYVGEVTELRNKVEETEINLSASEVLCKQLKEMIVSNEAQEEEYKCTISKLKGDIQEAVQKYKAESRKLKKATKQSMTLRRKAAEKDQREGSLRRVLRKMQKIMLEKGLVPPEIPENLCDQEEIFEGGDSDVELMDESDDEEPTVIVAVVRSEQEAEISVPSENVINIHDHGDNQSVSGESDCIIEEAFSDFADEIDAQLGNGETSDTGTPVKVAPVETKPAQEEKSTENTPKNVPPTESAENVRNALKQSSSPVKTGLSPSGIEGSITVLRKNSKRNDSCVLRDDGKNVKFLTSESKNEMAMDTSPILNRLGKSESLSDGEGDKKEEKEFVQPGGKIAVGFRETDGKDGVRGRRQRLKRKDKGKKKEECSDEDREEAARQEESSSKSCHKSLLYRRTDVISSSLSDSSSDEEIEELKERERKKGKAKKMEGRDKGEVEKVRLGEDSIFEEEINQSQRDDTMNNDSIDKSTEKKLSASKERLCSQGEEKLEEDLKKDEREVEQNLEKELNLEDKLQDKGNINISDDVEVDTKTEQREQSENCSSLGQTGENVTKNILVDEKRDIAEKGIEDRGQQNSGRDAILLQSPRRVTRGMLKSLQDTKALRDNNGNHLKQENEDEETKPRDGGSGSATSCRMKSLDDSMTGLGDRRKGEMKRQHEGEDANKKLLSVEVVKGEENLEASLFDIEDVENEKIDEEMNDIPEKKVQENEDQAGEGIRASGDEKEVVSGSNGDSAVTVESAGVLNKKQDQIKVEICEEKHLIGISKSSGDIDRLDSDDQSELDGRQSDSGLRMTRSKMKTVHVKEEFSGKRVTRLKAKMIPEVAEYLEVGDGNLSGKNMKQRGTRRSNSKAKSTSKSVELLSTCESENDEVERKRKVEASPRKNLIERMKENKGDTETVSSVVVKEEEEKSLVGENIKDEECGISPVENLSGNREQFGSKRVKPKRNVSFLEEKKHIESEEVSVVGVFVKKEVVSCEDAKSDSKKDIDEKTQSTEGKGLKRKITKERKLEMEVVHDIKTEPDDKHINLPNNGDAVGGKRKKTKGMKSKRKRTETKDEILNTFSCRRVAFESDGENEEGKRKDKSAAISPKSTNVNSGHSKKSEPSKVGTFKEVIQEAERYRSGSELSDSLSSPKSAGFSPSRETPFGFEKPKVVLQTSKKLSTQGKRDGDLRLADEKVEDDGSDEMGKGEVTVFMRTKENIRSSNNGVQCKSLLQEGKGSSQRFEGEPSHSQRNSRRVRGDLDNFNQSLEAKDRSGNFPSELPFENLMNLDRVSPIPVSPHEVIEEPLLEPMIASILDSLPLITRMLSPIPGSPSRDNEVGNRDDDHEEQEQHQILSPLSPSDPVSFLPPFSTTDTSRPLSPLPLTPVPGEDTPEVFDEPCGQKSIERGEPSIALPMNFHAVAPAGVIAVKPQVGTSFNSVKNLIQSNTHDTSQILVPGPDNLAEMKEKDIENSASQGKNKFVNKKNGEESKCGLKKTQNNLPSANRKDGKKEVPTKEECGQPKDREGGTIEEQVVEGDALKGAGTGDNKLEQMYRMNEEPSILDDKSKESNENRVVQEMETSSHFDDNQLKELKAGEKVSFRLGSDVDSAETEEIIHDDEVDSNINKKESVGEEKEKIGDKPRDRGIAGKIEEKMFVDFKEGMQSVEGKNMSLTPVPEVGCTKEDDALSSSSVSGEERWERLQSSNSKQGISKDIDQEEKKGNKSKDLLGKSNISDEQENKNTKEGIESEKGSSSGLKREGSLGFICTKDMGESESLSSTSLKSPSNVSLNISGKTEVEQEKYKEQMKFGGFASPKTDAKKEISKVKENTANEHKGKGGRTKDKARTPSGSSEHETEDDSTDFVDYNINTRERPKVDSSVVPSSKLKVAQIWGNIAEKSLAEDKEDVICKRKNWREHSKLKKQKISTGSRLMSDSETVSNEDIGLDELIKEINEMVEETQHTVIHRTIQYLKKNSLDLLATVISKVQRKDFSLDPVITKDEEKFIEAISQRDKKVEHMDKLAPQLMMCLSTVISCEKTKEKDPKDHSKKVTYCRIFAALCRLQGDAMMLRVLCYDIVKKKVHRWEELLVCISSVWSTALTKIEDESLQPVICVLEFLTWQRLKLPDNKQNLSDALWQALEFLCQWREPSIKEDDKMIQSLTDNMKDCELIKFKDQLTTFSSLKHPSFEIVKAIELIAWNKGWQWTWAVVIQSHVWPAMGGLCKELSLGQTQKASCMCCCLKVLGNLGHVGLKDEQNQSVFDLMKMIAEILTQSIETIPPVVQVYAVQTILNLAPIQPFFANECLQKWIQDHQDIQLLRNEKARMDTLANFVKSYKKPRNPANQRSRPQGKQTNYNRMPPPQDFSSPKRGGHQRRPKRPQFGQ